MENDWIVEAGIPVPKPRGSNIVFGFIYTLKVGECALLTGPVNRASLRASITYARQRYGKKFATRKTGDGVRVWRLA